MKKLAKRMLRSLKNTKGQFLSIVLIIAVGSVLLAGMFGSQTAMINSVDSYYEQQNLADVWCYFKGISQDEIDVLFSSDDVYAAEGRYSYLAELMVNNVQSELLIHSITRINSSLLSEGEYPENINEIIVDNKYAKANQITTGDTLEIETDCGLQQVTVTGFCYNPEAVVVQKDAASSSVSHSEFGVAYATSETLIALNRTTTLYLDIYGELLKKMADIQKELDDAASQISDAQKEYSDAKSNAAVELENAQSELDNADKAIVDAHSELSLQQQNAKQEFDKAQIQINNAQTQLNENRQQAESELASMQAQLDETKGQIDSGRTELYRKKRESEEQFDELQVQINTAQTQIDENKRLLDIAYAEYQATRPQLFPEEQEKMDADFFAQYALLDQKEAELTVQREELLNKYEQTQATLDEKELQLTAAEVSYEKALGGLIAKKPANKKSSVF